MRPPGFSQCRGYRSAECPIGTVFDTPLTRAAGRGELRHELRGTRFSAGSGQPTRLVDSTMSSMNTLKGRGPSRLEHGPAEPMLLKVGKLNALLPSGVRRHAQLRLRCAVDDHVDRVVRGVHLPLHAQPPATDGGSSGAPRRPVPVAPPSEPTPQTLPVLLSWISCPPIGRTRSPLPVTSTST